MAKAPILVDIKRLGELVEGLDLGDKHRNDYIKARWLNYIEWWDSRASNAKRNYVALRTAVVIGSALIPALVGLRELDVWNNIGGKDYGPVFAIASIVASLVVAICSGLESLFGYGDMWREKRNAAEAIKSEGFSFLQLCGPYRTYNSHQEAFKLFAENVEELIRNEIKEYIVVVGPKQPGTPPAIEGK